MEGPGWKEETTLGVDRDNLDIHGIVLTAVVFTLVTVLVVIAVQIGYHLVQADELRRKVVAVPDREVTELEAAQTASLGGYRWLDRERGTVAIPIERAMALVAAENGAPDPTGDE